MVHAADILRRQNQTRARLAESRIEAAPQYLIALAGFLETLLHIAPDFAGQTDAMRIVFQRIATHIEAVDDRIHIESGSKTSIFVGVISQSWLGSSRRDLAQLSLL